MNTHKTIQILTKLIKTIFLGKKSAFTLDKTPQIVTLQLPKVG
jgi:hypothetical protein